MEDIKEEQEKKEEIIDIFELEKGKINDLTVGIMKEFGWEIFTVWNLKKAFPDYEEIPLKWDLLTKWDTAIPLYNRLTKAEIITDDTKYKDVFRKITALISKTFLE